MDVLKDLHFFRCALTQRCRHARRSGSTRARFPKRLTSPCARHASAHLARVAPRRKVPRDLTEATLAGGGLSLISAIIMAYLFISNIVQYLSTTHSTSIVLDRSEDKRLQINFNITLPHLACRFASVDVSDVMGTQILNVSRSVQKHQIDGDGRFVGLVADRAKELVYADSQKGSEAKTDGHSVPIADVAAFEAVVGKSELVLVNFYAPWCPWSQRLVRAGPVPLPAAAAQRRGACSSAASATAKAGGGGGGLARNWTVQLCV